MLAFQIYLNGKKICTAVTDGLNTLTSGVGFFKQKRPSERQPVTNLTVAGVRLDPGKIVTWKQHELRLGDVVEIRLVETDDVQAPETATDYPDSHAP